MRDDFTSKITFSLVNYLSKILRKTDSRFSECIRFRNSKCWQISDKSAHKSDHRVCLAHQNSWNLLWHLLLVTLSQMMFLAVLSLLWKCKMSTNEGDNKLIKIKIASLPQGCSHFLFNTKTRQTYWVLATRGSLCSRPNLNKYWTISGVIAIYWTGHTRLGKINENE